MTGDEDMGVAFALFLIPFIMLFMAIEFIINMAYWILVVAMIAGGMLVANAGAIVWVISNIVGKKYNKSCKPGRISGVIIIVLGVVISVLGLLALILSL